MKAPKVKLPAMLWTAVLGVAFMVALISITNSAKEAEAAVRAASHVQVVKPTKLPAEKPAMTDVVVDQTETPAQPQPQPAPVAPAAPSRPARPVTPRHQPPAQPAAPRPADPPRIPFTNKPVQPGNPDSYVGTYGQCPFYENAGEKGCVPPPGVTCNADWSHCTMESKP